MQTEDELRELQKLPAVVRDTITNGDTWNNIANIGLRFQLHIDAIGSLADTVKRMLFGRISPSQLMNEMRAMGIEDTKINDIARALNEQIFKPLHQKMRVGMDDAYRISPTVLTEVPAPLGRPSRLASEALLTPQQALQVSANAQSVPPVFQPPSHSITPSVEAPQAFERTPQSISRTYSNDPYREPIE